MIEHHKARLMAMQGLCCLDVQGDDGMDAALGFLRDGTEGLETTDESECMIRGVLAGRDEIDELLSGQSRHWKVARMGLVERNILRLAVWELLTNHTPKKVVLNEAVRLAKEFASAESSNFVNGVLDATAERIAENSSPDLRRGA